MMRPLYKTHEGLHVLRPTALSSRDIAGDGNSEVPWSRQIFAVMAIVLLISHHDGFAWPVQLPTKMKTR